MKKLLGMVGSWLGVLLLCYAGLEFTFYTWAPRLFTLAALLQHSPMDMQPLLQTSRASVDPAPDYLALFGDSYAFGQGDWLYAVQQQRQPDYQATHVLHRTLQRDVVSFGRPASSSLKAYLEYPLGTLAYWRSLPGHRLPDPSTIVLYFYEGNDVMDNWQEYQVRFLGKGYPADALGDRAVFARFVANDVLASPDTAPTARLLPLATFGYSVWHHAWQQWQARHAPAGKPFFKPQPRETNRVQLAGADAFLPDRLQVPPVALTADERRVSLQVLAQTLAQLQQAFPRASIGMVYVPAVATPYRIVAETVHVYDDQRGKAYPAASLLPMSDETCSAVAQIAQSAGISFRDTRPAFRAAAAQQWLHGPEDWQHFNEAGYRLLAGEIISLLQAMERQAPPAGCSRLAG